MMMVVMLSRAAHLMHMRTARPTPRGSRYGRPTNKRPAIRARALHEDRSWRSATAATAAARPSMGMSATARARYAMRVVLCRRKEKRRWASLPERRCRRRRDQARGCHGLFRDAVATCTGARRRWEKRSGGWCGPPRGTGNGRRGHGRGRARV